MHNFIKITNDEVPAYCIINTIYFNVPKTFEGQDNLLLLP